MHLQPGPGRLRRPALAALRVLRVLEVVASRADPVAGAQVVSALDARHEHSRRVVGVRHVALVHDQPLDLRVRLLHPLDRVLLEARVEAEEHLDLLRRGRQQVEGGDALLAGALVLLGAGAVRPALAHLAPLAVPALGAAAAASAGAALAALHLHHHVHHHLHHVHGGLAATLAVAHDVAAVGLLDGCLLGDALRLLDLAAVPALALGAPLAVRLADHGGLRAPAKRPTRARLQPPVRA
mmetsp:Transcript_24935/g.50595  ORF Transcript_24935/g.50595 Transcript_24935/m.50595 type:complete len:239 (+) Transcript_24935:293-1009(+)